MRVVLNNNALVIGNCEGVQCVWNIMCVKITYNNNSFSVLFL